MPETEVPPAPSPTPPTARSRTTLWVAALAALALIVVAFIVLRGARNGAEEAAPGAPVETSTAPADETGAAAGAEDRAEAEAETEAETGTDTRTGLPALADDPRLAMLLTEPPARDMVDLAVRFGRIDGPASSAPRDAAQEYAVGDRETFWVHDIDGERYFQVEAAMEAMGDNAYFWVQDGLTMDLEDLRRGGRVFSDEIMPALRDVYGTEWSPGVDGDPRVHVLHHESIPGVAGYFSSTDELPREVEPYSNEREMFYINASSYRPGAYRYLSLLAHEFQHMIHYNMDRDEPVWANEGLADLAATIAGYEGQNGTAFFSNPDVGLLQWEAATGANAPHYAASYALFAYIRARYGDDAIRAIVAAPENGPNGIEAGLAAIGETQTFDDLFLDWVVANRVHDNGRADDRFSYGDLGGLDRVTADPLPESGVRSVVNQHGTDYYDVTQNVSDGTLDLSFEGDATVGLLGAVPAADGAVWWSNNGDSADSRLTRTFDLSGVDEAELSFRMWHALETNWDYAYFLASTDGGQTWQRLATSRTTDDNPNGNNYGAGLTGESFGWVDESLDLTPFAGAPVDVRFEMVTDDAISLAGLALDDVRLDAIGFSDDAESDTGWNAEGWLRLDPELPQRWAVQVIVDGPDAVTVHRVAVDLAGTARITLDAIPDGATVTLAVSAVTPATRNTGGYEVGRGSAG